MTVATKAPAEVHIRSIKTRTAATSIAPNIYSHLKGCFSEQEKTGILFRQGSDGRIRLAPARERILSLEVILCQTRSGNRWFVSVLLDVNPRVGRIMESHVCARALTCPTLPQGARKGWDTRCEAWGTRHRWRGEKLSIRGSVGPLSHRDQERDQVLPGVIEGEDRRIRQVRSPS